LSRKRLDNFSDPGFPFFAFSSRRRLLAPNVGNTACELHPWCSPAVFCQIFVVDQYLCQRSTKDLRVDERDEAGIMSQVPRGISRIVDEERRFVARIVEIQVPDRTFKILVVHVKNS